MAKVSFLIFHKIVIRTFTGLVLFGENGKACKNFTYLFITSGLHYQAQKQFPQPQANKLFCPAGFF